MCMRRPFVSRIDPQRSEVKSRQANNNLCKMLKVAPLILLLIASGALNAPLPMEHDAEINQAATTPASETPLAGNATELENGLQPTTLAPDAESAQLELTTTEVPTTQSNDALEAQGGLMITTMVPPEDATERVKPLHQAMNQADDRETMESAAGRIVSTVVPPEDATERVKSLHQAMNQADDRETMESAAGRIVSTVVPPEDATERVKALQQGPKDSEVAGGLLMKSFFPPYLQATGDKEPDMNSAEGRLMTTMVPPEDATERVKGLKESEGAGVGPEAFLMTTWFPPYLQATGDQGPGMESAEGRLMTTMVPPEDATERANALQQAFEDNEGVRAGDGAGNQLMTTVSPPLLQATGDHAMENHEGHIPTTVLPTEQATERVHAFHAFQALDNHEHSMPDTVEHGTTTVAAPEEDTSQAPAESTTVVPSEEATEKLQPARVQFADIIIMRADELNEDSGTHDHPTLNDLQLSTTTEAATTENVLSDDSTSEATPGTTVEPRQDQEQATTILPLVGQDRSGNSENKFQLMGNGLIQADAALRDTTMTSLEEEDAVVKSVHSIVQEEGMLQVTTCHPHLQSQDAPAVPASPQPETDCMGELQSPRGGSDHEATEESSTTEVTTTATATMPPKAELLAAMAMMGSQMETSSVVMPAESTTLEETTVPGLDSTTEMEATVPARLHGAVAEHEAPEPATTTTAAVTATATAPANMETTTAASTEPAIEARVVQVQASDTFAASMGQLAEEALEPTTTMRPAEDTSTEDTTPAESTEATTAADLETTTEMAVASESPQPQPQPEARALHTTPPKIHRYVSEDGVEVISGYSFVMHS